MKLPPFIEKLVNGNLSNDFTFDYFNENSEEVVFHRSICFSVDDLMVLISNMEKCKDRLFADKNNNKKIQYLQITFDRVIGDSNKEILEELKNLEEYEIIKSEKKKKDKQGKKYLNYFLFTDLLVNNKYLNKIYLKRK